MMPSLTQAILPIAGLGTRFLPWTKAVPKEMLPIGNRPIIALIVDECLGVGIRDICFVISKGKEIIPQYFQHDEALNEELRRRGKLHLLEEISKYDEVRFHTVFQHEQRGDGHAILQAADWVASEELAILFGDDLFLGDETALRQLVQAHELCEPVSAVIAVENIPREMTSKYGIVKVQKAHARDSRLHSLDGLVEKPAPDDAPSTLGIVGRYLIPRATMGVLRTVKSGTKDGEIRLIDALIKQLAATPIYAYECRGKRVDTGTPEGYRDAVLCS